MSDFDDSVKIEAFDLIAKKCFEHNFGQTSKGDFEVLLFKIYLENVQCHNNDASDFAIATALGITEAKVRNLKVKKELQYPGSKSEWKIDFIKLIKYACLDEKTDLVKISITDPNIKRNLEHRIDCLHLYSEAQLNGKILQMRPDHFVELVMSLSEELDYTGITQADLIKKLESSTVAGKFKSEGIIERLQAGEAAKDMIQDIIKAAGKVGIKLLLQSIPFGTTLTPYIDTFIDKL